MPILRPFIYRCEAATGRAEVRRLALIQARRHPLHLAVVGVIAQVELQRLQRRSIGDDAFSSGFIGLIDWLYVWDRAIAPAAMQAVSVQPFQLFQAPSR